MRVVRSPHAHARFELGDLGDAACTLAGHWSTSSALADVPNNAFAIFPDLRDQPVLADGVVRFRGEAVLALVGDAATVLAIDDGDAADPLPAARGARIDSPPRSPLPITARHCTRAIQTTCCATAGSSAATSTPRCAGAAIVVDSAFTTRHVEHAYIEPEAGYAEVVAGSDAGGAPLRRVRIFACTQTPYMDRDEIASVLAITPEQVHIVPSAIGGGFGGKLDLSVQPLVAVAAWKLGRPVRLVYERPESMQSSTKRHPAEMHASAACDLDGRLRRLRLRGDFNTGAYSSWGPTVANRVPIHASGPYRVPNVRALTRAVLTNDSIAGAFRGFGVPQSTLLGELLIDELAARAGRDALEFRHRNALVAGDVDADRPDARGQRRPAGVPRRAPADVGGGRSCRARVQRDGRHDSARRCAAALASPACGTASATP